MSATRLLTAGQRLRLADGPGEAVVGAFIGSGGQGEVYSAEVFGRSAALKWYLPSYLVQDPGLWDRLERIIFSPPPSPSFVWPYARVVPGSGPGFGYLMPLRQERFLSFRDLIYGDVERTFELLLTVGLNVCESLRRLHLKGLCYRDLNLGNFCFDAKTGAVEVLDNDNTDAEGEGVSIGVTDFAAPELLLGAAKASRYTDLWSLAVLLFQLTVLTDPFIGQRLVTEHGGVYDSDANRQLHARPVFIFDPQDQSNLPLPGETRAEALWRRYPEALRALFIKSFTIGARAPRARVTEAEWEQALIRARDGLVPCASCDAHNILEFEATRSTAPDCLACGQPLVMPRVLKIGAWRVALRAGARLRRHHLGRAGAHDPSSPIAEVIASPVRLRNLSPFHWTCSAGGGQRAVVGEGDCVVIEDDLRIDFGAAQGYVAQS